MLEFTTGSRWDTKTYLLDPALEAEHQEMVALDKRADALDNWRLLPFLIAGFGGPIAGATVGHSSAGAGWITFGVITVLGIIAFIALTVPYRRLNAAVDAMCTGWVEDGHAALMDVLDRFAIGDVSNHVLFDAACILRDAEITERRLAWAQKAAEDSRLATGADDTVIEVADVYQAMVQRAADMLDPDAARTIDWLTEKTRDI